MGLDIRDVDLVVHIGCPKSVLSYWQEAGRCARDGRQGLSLIIYDMFTVSLKNTAKDIAKVFWKLTLSNNSLNRNTMRDSMHVDKPIIEPLSGTDFLSSTNFQVAQDTTETRKGLGSIFKTDYPPYNHYGRDAQAERPVLAEVMHRDQSYFKGDQSESTQAYEYRYLKKPVVTDSYQTLRATNFKTDRDLNKVDVFGTMHNHYYVPKVNNDYQRIGPATNTHQSHIPKGDPDKITQPWSDYNDKFRGHDTSVVKVFRAPSMHEGGPPTVKGDERLSNFNTTHNLMFPDKSQPRVKILSAPTGTNVPKGDPDKVLQRDTTMKESYSNLTSQHKHNPYLKSEVSGVLRRTNFQSEDCYKENDYFSTAINSYQPTSVPVDRYKPLKHRNHSDFPPGDMENSRVLERVNTTTARVYHGNPPLGIHNTIISGANLRTKSKVSFGEPQLNRNFYDTTNYDTFKGVKVPYTYDRTKFHKESSIPVNYYSKEETDHSSSYTDYKDPVQAKMIPHNTALNNLKMSHILPPLSGPQRHNTTHQVMFTPKESEKYSYDSGRLQRSSVPLGTMTCQ
ncbi:unnamed protein product [Mytilus edulis]|uniref:Helicase C-terminal domain-containing protein n=1 Tax=Mytilus edulis TaxID=6550 RepID=A0A8S3TX16_MYTED|nr:unnamed protein product [Mytilus edulis]